MENGDILTAKEARYIDALESLLAQVVDMIDGERLTENDIPDDFLALVNTVDQCNELSAGD